MQKRTWYILTIFVIALVVSALFMVPFDGVGAQGPEGEEGSELDVIDLIDVGPPTDIEAEPSPSERAEPELERDTIGTTSHTSGFTYQGQLLDGGSPANGTYDLQFVLYSASTGGSQIGALIVKDDTEVTDGVFSVLLDFGSSAFDGGSRYLEIGVRPDESTDPFTILSPRRPIAPTPYASYAYDADRLDGYDSSYFANYFHDHDGRYLRRRKGTQFSGTINAGQTKGYFTFGWPTDEVIYWAVQPTTEDGRLEWSTEIKRNASGFTYYITIKNVGSSTTEFAARYVRFE